MFLFTVLADDRRLAKTLHLIRADTERFHRAAAQQIAQLRPCRLQLGQVFRIAAGVGVFDHRDSRALTRRRIDGLTYLCSGFLDYRDNFSD